MKLLYYTDFMHYRETGKSVTGLTYYAWKFGPYPVELAKKIDNCDPELNKYFKIEKSKSQKSGRDIIKFKSVKKFNSRFFSKRELRIIKNVAYIFKEAPADQMVESTHLKNHPWDRTIREKGEKQAIDYSLAFDDNTKNKEDILENIKDREQIEKALNGKGISTLP